MIFIFFFDFVFSLTKISIGQEEIRIFQNCPNNFESFETFQFGGESDGLRSNFELSAREKTVEICCKPCCECYTTVNCANEAELILQNEKRSQIVDFLKRALSWTFIEKLHIHGSCEDFFQLKKGTDFFKIFFLDFYVLEIFFYFPKLTSASLITDSGTKTLFEINEDAKINRCAPEVVVISSKIVKNMLKEENSRWTEVIIDIHDEEFSMQERSSVFEDLRFCPKRKMTAKMIKIKK